MSGTERRHPDTKRRWPATLSDRRRRWLETLSTGATVRDRFPLRDKTAIVRLRPSDVAIRPALDLEMDRFVRRMDETSYQLQGISPRSPIAVEPGSSYSPRTFYGGAYLIAPGVQEPPDHDNWGRGPGSLEDVLPGSRTRQLTTGGEDDDEGRVHELGSAT